MSNARRLPPQAESPPEAQVESRESADSPTPPDHLADYRKSLEDLSSAQEKLATLRALEVSLRADAEGIATAREKVLADSVSGPDDDGALEELGRLRSRAELFERKLADVAGRIREAENELARRCEALSAACSIMQQALMGWAFGRARVELANLLDGAIAPHLVDVVATHHAKLIPIRALQITASDPETLLAQGTRLLEASQAAEGLQIPAAALAALERVPGAVAEPPKPRKIGPWSDRGMSQHQINEALTRIRTENPALSMSEAHEEMARLYPQLFISEQEFMAMNAPLAPARSPLARANQQQEAA